MFKVSIVLLLIVAFAVASDIAAFGKCMKTCRKNKQAFRFCLSYCKPSKNETIAVVPAVEKEAVADEQEADSQFGTVPDSKDLWKKYRQVLMDFLRQGNADLFPGLQLVPQPFAADWDEDERILTNLCNRLPKPGQAYEQSVYELTNEYGDFITNIIVPDDKPVDRTKFDAARREIRTIENRINDAEMECADQFDARTARRRSPSLPPIEPFDLYSIRYCKDIEEARRDLTNVLYNYEILKRSEYGEHFRLKDSVVKFSETRDKKFVAFGSLARFVAAMKENRGNSFEVKINQSTRTSSEKTSSMNIDVGFKNDFITVGAGYQSTSMKLSTSFKEFVLIVGAASYKYIPVFPDRTWFSPEVIYKYGRYPMRNAKNYFGGAGTMPLIPKGFIVAAGPKVTMLLNAEDTSKMEKTSQLKLNLNVAGFDFAFGKNAGMKKSQESANLFRVELNGNSFEPLILAVDNQVNELLINQAQK